MAVEGILAALVVLLAVGCDGVLGSDAKLDKCGVCKGDDTTCHIVSGIFTRFSLPYGYSLVTTIPQGACNINITEMQYSRNYLALKLGNGGPYIINGNSALGFSNDYEGAGTVFRYYHPDSPSTTQKQSILSIGPVDQSVDIMLLKQDENKGIMYSYTIPTEEGDVTTDGDQTKNKKHHGHHRHHGDKKPHQDRDREEYADPNAIQQDQQQPQYSDRYQAYLERERRRQRERTANLNSQRETQQPGRRRTSQSSQQGYQPDQYRQPVVAPRPQQPQSSYPLPNQASTGYGYNQQGGYQQPPRYNGGQPGYQPPRYPGYTQPQTQGAQYVLPLQQQGGGYRQPPQLSYQPRPQYVAAQGSNYQAQGGSVAYIPPSYANQRQEQTLGQTRYDPRYRGAESQTAYRGAVNDQIAQQLPSSSRLRIGEPLDSSAEFSWKISGFTECSRTCGGGTQTTVIVCVKPDRGAVVTNENCDNALKPQVQSVTCANNPCDPDWHMTEWTPCSTSCGVGQQTRIVECKQRVSESVQIRVSASQCQHTRKPITIQRCNQDRPCIGWRLGEWTECSAECGRGQRSRDVTCVDASRTAIPESNCPSPKPNKVEICDMGSCAEAWFHTRWSDQCSSGCGEGTNSRRTFCHSSDPTKCRPNDKPGESRSCKNELPCGGQWFAGPWSQCTVTCGTGAIQRDIVCMKKLGPVMAVVSNGNCQHQEEPETETPCQMPPCEAEWYMTEWTKCSKSCNTGFRTREVKCLDTFQFTSTACDQLEKPQVRETCNTRHCPLHDRETDASCTDKFDNCQLVARAPRLCKYAYYRSVCCVSCQSSHHHNHHQNQHNRRRGT